MAFVRVASLGELAPGTVMEAQFNGEPYAICNLAGEVRAFAGTCPHAGGPLGEGIIDGENLVCPWHAWEYNCRTGVNTYDDSVRLASFAVKVEGDDILVDLT